MKEKTPLWNILLFVQFQKPIYVDVLPALVLCNVLCRKHANLLCTSMSSKFGVPTLLLLSNRNTMSASPSHPSPRLGLLTHWPPVQLYNSSLLHLCSVTYEES